MVHWWVMAGIAPYGAVGLMEGMSGQYEVDTQSGGSWSPRGCYDLIARWRGCCMAGGTATSHLSTVTVAKRAYGAISHAITRSPDHP